MQKPIQKLLKKSLNFKFIKEVFKFAEEKYKNKKWIEGGYYIDHVLRIALLLKEIGVDETTIASALLYGVADTSPDLKSQTVNEVEKKFGKETAYLVQKTAELNKIYYFLKINLLDKNQSSGENIEKIIKMFFAIAGDFRVILIKIVSRIDSLSNLNFLSSENKKLYATETLKIFVPIANRLGLGEIRRKLEDLAFAKLYPEEYKWLQENIKEKYEERKNYLEKFIPRLKKILKHEKIRFLEINYRAKSYWSTYQKLLSHDMNVEAIHDLVALRIIVKTIADCYRVVGSVHKYYEPITQEINDYIAKPKTNGYQALHTNVFLEGNRISEIQIKTEEMHKEAEYGICAHWSYKEKIDLKKEGEKFKWTREIIELQKKFKIDFFENEVFVFTPKGDVISLPKGSTPVDFAYAIHSNVGNHCEAAKVNGRIISLSQPLNNGDIVEIITSKSKKPSQDWLKFVKTGFARFHIRKIVAITFKPIFSVPIFIKKRILRIGEKLKKEKLQIQKSKVPEVYLGGQKGIAVNFAKCCSPKPGDIARAYLAKYRTAVLHKVSCKNFQKIAQKFPEKIVDASWKQS